MKVLIFICSAAILVLATAAKLPGISNADTNEGSWLARQGQEEQWILIKDQYFTWTAFDKVNKKFIRSFGGPISFDGTTAQVIIEFDTQVKDRIGQAFTYNYTRKDKHLALDLGTGLSSWQQDDDGKGDLAGNWRISGRMQGGEMSRIPKADRKTLKLLTGNRFQWMAINPATREFFGTGGGTYTFVNNQYTETIEFFSRDSSRVGASLSFAGTVKDNDWHHSGKSSKGDPLHEIWSREK